MIELRRVSKRYEDAAGFAVRDAVLHVEKGEFVVLLGESGCGKTTTLKMINRLIEPTSGEIEVDGLDIATMDPIALRRSIGYVFQGVGLFPHMTVRDNVAIVPHLFGWERGRIEARVDEVLEMVRLDPREFRGRMPAHLSGGQRQRVGAARALAAAPRIMLLDEPFGALDPLTRDKLQSEFSRLQDELDLTAVMVTHDMTEALLMADRIAVMKDGEIVGLGTPQAMMSDPPHDYIRALMEMPKRQADRIEELVATA